MVIVGAMAAAWGVVLVWPGDAPLPVLVVLVLVVGAGGPGSMVGFDVARTSNPGHRAASASGIINVGGFTASLLVIVLVGLLLDLQTPGDSANYTPEAFRWALASQYLFWAVGLVQVLRWRRRVRAVIARDQIEAGSSMVPGAPGDA